MNPRSWLGAFCFGVTEIERATAYDSHVSSSSCTGSTAFFGDARWCCPFHTGFCVCTGFVLDVDVDEVIEVSLTMVVGVESTLAGAFTGVVLCV